MARDSGSMEVEEDALYSNYYIYCLILLLFILSFVYRVAIFNAAS